MRALGRVVLPPLLVVAALNAVFFGAARYAGAPFFAFDTWIKWDSGHYLTIAKSGYEFMSCSQVPGYDPSQWCGNSGWFPGYPYLLAGLHHVTHARTILLAVVTSQVFALVDLLLVWNLFLSRRNLAALLICGFAPGTYYFLVGFPMSLTVCLLILALWAEAAEADGLAFTLGMAAAMCYPSGVWFSGVVALAAGVRAWRRGHARIGWIVAALGPTIGFGLVLLIQYGAVGRWNAFFLTQAKYGHRLSVPFQVLWERSRYLWYGALEWPIGLQSLVAAALVVALLVTIARRLGRRTDVPADLLVAAYALVYWILPLSLGGTLSPYRAESLLMPAMTGVRTWRPAALWSLAGGLAAIWAVMAVRFIQGSLV